MDTGKTYKVSAKRPDTGVEEWVEVPEYEGYYEVSSLGRIRRMPRHSADKNTAIFRGRVLKPTIHGSGYLITILSKNNQKKWVQMHRLILEAFVGISPDAHLACHNDGDRTNNALSNLRWDTQKNNLSDRKIHGTSFDGARNPAAKLTERQVLKISGMMLPPKFISTAFKISLSQAYAVSRKKSWKGIKYV